MIIPMRILTRKCHRLLWPCSLMNEADIMATLTVQL